ncbi:type II toxin-antitoxin system HigB family toxin [Aequorivita flava]|uniref:Type II toxin-antitoxin system HigB family toxin n=1 Tax=Aequorivita flava TaxID=3114371 RepID=A0AB35YUB1_9FLAO
MRIIALGTLRQFWLKHPDSKEQLVVWYKNFSKSSYLNPNQIREVYRSADNVGNGRIVFNICRNEYRLIVKFNYKFQFGYIRFIGTHKEYDKITDIKNI